MNIVENIESIDIPTRSPAAAIQHMHDHGWFEKTGADYHTLIEAVSGVAPDTEDARELNYTFRYLVTTAIDHPGHKGKHLLAMAYGKAKEFIKTHGFVFAVAEVDATPKLDATGKPKPKKGAKKEMARKVYDEKIRDKELTRKESIAILMEEVGMSQGGASTYYANLKKGTM